MPGKFLTESEFNRLKGFPNDITEEDIAIYFTFSKKEMRMVKKRRGDHNRLGFGLLIGAMRYMGFCPEELGSAPQNLIEYVAFQLDLPPSMRVLAEYGVREQSRSDHIMEIEHLLGYHKSTSCDLESLSKWLLERALEHDKPSLLFQLACEKLHAQKITRPGPSLLERMVITARRQAQEETFHRLSELLTVDRKRFLDSILLLTPDGNATQLAWLRNRATMNSPNEILNTLKKLTYLFNAKIHLWNLDCINPNRRKFLARIGKRSTPQALQRANAQKRYPILICFLKQILEETIDECIELYDRCMGDSYARSKRDLKIFQLAIAKTSNEKLRMLQRIGNFLLDTTITDTDIRQVIFENIGYEQLKNSLVECEMLIRPQVDNSFDYLANRYSYIREFAPKFLEVLTFKSNVQAVTVHAALQQIRELNSAGKRNVPSNAPIDFIPKSWRHLVMDKNGSIVRKYYEICALWRLRDNLRSGDIWVKDSRKYANIETYLIPREKWSNIIQSSAMTGLPTNGKERLIQRGCDLKRIASVIDANYSTYPNLRIKDGKMHLSRLEAEELPETAKTLQELITDRLPRIELADLLIEVDGWTNFTDYLEHASGCQPRTKRLQINLYASIIAQACNFGLGKMAEASGMSYKQLAWTTNWYLREETLQSAINNLVNFQFHQPLSRFWGVGTMSSSDGQRFPVPVRARNATAILRYYGYGKGLTFYSWTSDQFSQYGSKVTPSTMRDATCILDAILDNETELDIMEHTTDTAGYTEIIFALFDLLGMQFSPRIRDIGSQILYYMGEKFPYKHINPILKGKIDVKLILENWDDILRVISSLKLGWVTASLFVSRLQAHRRKNTLGRAIQEYGRLVKTISILKYVASPEKQRLVGLQLNKGEAVHDLRRFLIFANEGKLRRSQLEDQTNQASCLTLVTNAIIIWNTRYMHAVVNQLRSEGTIVRDSDLVHISPCRFYHINKYGRYTFNVDQDFSNGELRPLRNSKNP